MNNLIKELKDLIIKAGDIALTIQKSDLIIEHKEDKSPVSNADKEISECIYNKLQTLTPKITIICEEQPLPTIKSDTFWLIDPIDGTKSYIKGKNTYTINIGLIKNGSPTIGLIYLPAYAKLYYTDSAGKLKIEESLNSVEKLDPLSHIGEDGYNAVVSSSHINSSTKNFLAQYPINIVHAIPSSIKLCLIAEGQADIYPKFGETMEWDTAAGHALIKAVGGNLFDHNGQELQYNKSNFRNPNFYACNKRWIKAFYNKE